MEVIFASALDVVERGELEPRWKLARDLLAIVTQDNRQRCVCVPSGYVTDFASVPRLPLVFLVMGDTAHEAAGLHDYVCRGGG